MASPPLVLPGVLFVGEDERARIVAHTGPAAGWHVPKGILGWSTEVSVVQRDALTEEIRRSTKMVMPEEQIPPVKMPLTSQAALKSPLVAVSSKLVSKLVELGARVHTVGVDRVTSSFYYLAEGGGEEQIRIEGDLVQSVGAMLGERADNAAIERVLDGLPDRLLRALSKDRVSELTMELAAALPRAAADGSGTAEVDLEAFEKALSELVGSGEKYTTLAQEIASKLAETNDRRVEVPLFGEARKVSQGPFDIAVGERRVSLPTYERWVMSNAIGEPARASTAPAATTAAAAPKKHDSQDSMLANLESASSRNESNERAAAKAAEDAKAAEAAKAAEEARAAVAAAQRAADEARAVEEKRKAEAAKAAEEARAAEEKRKAEEAKAAEEKRKAEEAAKAAEAAKAEEAAKAAEAARAAEEAAKAAEETRKAEEAQVAAAKATQAAVEEAKNAEAKKAEAKKADDKKSNDKKSNDKNANQKKGKGKNGKNANANANAKAAEAKAADAKAADAKAADAKKTDAKKVDEKTAAKTAVASDKAKADTVKIKRAEKSSNMIYIVLLALAAAGFAFWKFYLHH
jgi:chemotaxis protein histidine kinase CheA